MDSAADFFLQIARIKTKGNIREIFSMARRGRASQKRRIYGGGSGITAPLEQYGVYAPGNPAGGKADFEEMSRDAADSMIAYPKEIFPADLIESKMKMHGGSVQMNMGDVQKMMAQAMGDSGSMKVGGRRRRATRKDRKDRKDRRKTMYGGKPKRKLSKSMSDWNKSVMKVYREMKMKDKDVKLKDAMKETKRRNDRGEL